MPQKHLTKKPQRVKPKKVDAFSKSLPRPKKISPRGLVQSKKSDTYARLKALKKIAAYSTRKNTTVKNITRSQMRGINKRFESIQNHGVFVRGKVIRPFEKRLQGYALNKQFKFVIGKVAQNKPGVIKTKIGAIVESLTNKTKIKNDGTIITKRKIMKKMRTIFSGSLNNEQTLKFMLQVSNGTFKFPKGFNLQLAIFGNQQSAQIFSNTEQIQNLFEKYFDKISTNIKQHPNDPSPLSMEIWRR